MEACGESIRVGEWRQVSTGTGKTWKVSFGHGECSQVGSDEKRLVGQKALR